jgi:hypothetical protein
MNKKDQRQANHVRLEIADYFDRRFKRNVDGFSTLPRPPLVDNPRPKTLRDLQLNKHGIRIL